jgi:hypothetical protein
MKPLGRRLGRNDYKKTGGTMKNHPAGQAMLNGKLHFAVWREI